MASKGLIMLSLVVLLVSNCCTTTCHARLLKGFVLSNGDDKVVIATASASASASIPGLNLALPVKLFETSEQGPSLPSGSNAGEGVFLDVEDNKGVKYMKLRSLVLASLPKGKKPSSGPSKKHNDFNA